jgi:hypothetical protein
MVAAVLVPSIAGACSCEYPPFEQEFAQSAAVFRGTVVSIVAADPQYFESVLISLEASAWWKGTPIGTVALLTGTNEAICGYPFAVGGEYVVFAHRPNASEPLVVTLCGLTHQPYPGDPILGALGPPITVAVAAHDWSVIKALYR